MPQTFQQWIGFALWLAGAGHFAVLIASFQVPYRLDWKQDLSKLTPLNRKFMWVHGAFTVYTIISFGALTLLLHDDILRGQRSALALATFIGVYWLLRVVVDFTYYDHSDWPKGRAFVAGHVLLTSLFIFLAATYLCASLMHLPSRVKLPLHSAGCTALPFARPVAVSLVPAETNDAIPGPTAIAILEIPV